MQAQSTVLIGGPAARTSLHFFFQAEDGIRDGRVTGVQTCALPISRGSRSSRLLESSSGTSPTGKSSSSPARRSEERRVGKECRSRWATDDLTKKSASDV